MSVLNPNSDDEPQECPLCLEYLELDDISFYPCSCGYQVSPETAPI
jgi:CCR4-NOT transcription complex subunit 4